MSNRLVLEVKSGRSAESAEERTHLTWWDGPSQFAPYPLRNSPDFRCRAQEARDKLEDFAYLIRDKKLGESDWLELAQKGSDLYRAIFEPDEARDPKSWIQSLARQNLIESLEVVVTEGQLWIPWNLVYESSSYPEDADSVDKSLFWGHRYNIAVTVSSVSPNRRRPWLDPTSTIVVPAGEEILDAELTNQGGAIPTPATEPLPACAIVVRTKTEFQKAVRGIRPDLLYWMGHASGSTLRLASDESIELSEISDLLRRYHYQKPHGGLFFLNVCESLNPVKGSYDPWNIVRNTEYSGLIGTEARVYVVNANDLGLNFLRTFLEGGVPVAALLRELRQDNDLGLFYTACCPPNVQVMRSEGAPPPAAATVVLTASPAPIPDRTAVPSSVQRGMLGGGPTPTPLPEIPYPGLASYERQSRALFAGREDDCIRFTMILDEPATRIMVLHGESGVGKTSFLQAEAIPYLEEEAIGYRFLREGSHDSPVLFIRAGKDLLRELASRLFPFLTKTWSLPRPDGKTREIAPVPLAELFGGTMPASSAELAASLESDPDLLEEFLRALAGMLPYRLLLIIDQAEELFTIHEPARRDVACDALASLAGKENANFKLVVSLRTEYYGRLKDAFRRRLRPESESRFREYLLRELDRESLAEAIRLPTSTKGNPYSVEIPREKYRFRYSPESLPDTIAEEILAATRSNRDGALVLMQIVCSQLYKGPETVVSEDDWKTSGGVSGGLRRHLDLLLQNVFPDEADRLLLQRVLICLYMRQPDNTLTTRILSKQSLESELRRRFAGFDSVRLERILDIASKPEHRLLKTGRFEVAGRDASTDHFSLGHDSLAVMASAWDREFEQQAAVQQEKAAKEKALRVVETELKLREAEIARAKAESKLGKEQRRKALMFVGAVVAVLAGAYYVWSQRQASGIQQRSRLIGREAQSVFASSPERGLTLAVEAQDRFEGDLSTRLVLAGFLNSDSNWISSIPVAGNQVCKAAHDGSTAAVLLRNGGLLLYDIASDPPKLGGQSVPDADLGKILSRRSVCDSATLTVHSETKLVTAATAKGLDVYAMDGMAHSSHSIRCDGNELVALPDPAGRRVAVFCGNELRIETFDGKILGNKVTYPASAGGSPILAWNPKVKVNGVSTLAVGFPNGLVETLPVAMSGIGRGVAQLTAVPMPTPTASKPEEDDDSDSHPTSPVAFSPDGGWLAATRGREKTIWLIRLADRKVFHLLKPEKNRMVSALAWIGTDLQFIAAESPFERTSIFKIDSADLAANQEKDLASTGYEFVGDEVEDGFVADSQLRGVFWGINGTILRWDSRSLGIRVSTVRPRRNLRIWPQDDERMRVTASRFTGNGDVYMGMVGSEEGASYTLYRGKLGESVFRPEVVARSRFRWTAIQCDDILKECIALDQRGTGWIMPAKTSFSLGLPEDWSVVRSTLGPNRRLGIVARPSPERRPNRGIVLGSGCRAVAFVYSLDEKALRKIPVPDQTCPSDVEFLDRSTIAVTYSSGRLGAFSVETLQSSPSPSLEWAIPSRFFRVTPDLSLSIRQYGGLIRIRDLARNKDRESPAGSAGEFTSQSIRPNFSVSPDSALMLYRVDAVRSGSSIWDLKENGYVGSIRVGFSEGTSISSGGQYVINSEGLFDLTAARLKFLAKRRVNRNMTKEEWTNTFPNENCRETFKNLPSCGDGK